MRLSTRGRFAVTAMIDLALRDDSNPVPLVDLAQRHRISLSYLEQVFAKLRRHQLVDSTRGPGGGYTLGYRGDTITVADIVTAIEDDDIEPDPLKHGGDQGTPDMTRELWDGLHATILAYMKTVSLRSLAAEQRAKGFQVAARRPTKNGVSAKFKPAFAPERPMGPNWVFALGRA
ncbi:Rrf2 family transcriptional regulator [Rhodoferax sp.]|uniref:Rrf2 family transcriptional regulator n=1 Tax=Rhodoferax sp. TaxID=50421 RepID=UPI002771C05A|nr:Rrf2 family transcriptional regulator [Rhodoferax sp.]